MTERNIFQEVEEDLERQKMEDLWRRYGIFVIALAVLVVAGTAGYTMWHTMQLEKNQQVSDGLLTILNQTKAEPAKQITDLTAFADKNPGKTQAVFARLQAGAMAAKQGDKDKAAGIYDAVASDTSVDPVFRQLGDLMSVQVQMDTGNADTLQKRLQPLMADNAPWRYSAKEDAGYLAWHSGDKAKARQIFTELSQDAASPHTVSDRAADMARLLAE